MLASLLLLKVAHPEAVHLLRGNHECSLLSAVYGFRDELARKYPAHAEDLWAEIQNVFGALPLAARTAEAFIVHGGLPSAQFELEELQRLGGDERARISALVPRGAKAGGGGSGAADEAAAALIQGLLWSDPSADEVGFRPNANRGGAGAVFGPDAAGEWLRRHGLRHLVSSLEPKRAVLEKMRVDCEVKKSPPEK